MPTMRNSACKGWIWDSSILKEKSKISVWTWSGFEKKKIAIRYAPALNLYFEGPSN